eukprot:4848944-Pyramimonas_sp.AAC.1
MHHSDTPPLSNHRRLVRSNLEIFGEPPQAEGGVGRLHKLSNLGGSTSETDTPSRRPYVRSTPSPSAAGERLAALGMAGEDAMSAEGTHRR